MSGLDDIIYAFAVTVIAISLIIRVCERMAEAMQELDEEQERARKESPEGQDEAD